MNYLIALLAFSAVMVVLATLVTVLVEGIHKFHRTRSQDFDELLTQLYKKSVRPQFKRAGIELSKDADSFVQQIRENPAIARRKSLFNKFLVNTEFEKLNTRQFVEQFAQTEAGQKLLLKIEQREAKGVADTISNLSYQFERYSEAASEYFRRRAAFLSLVVALLLAITLNIDAIRLYGALANDTALANQVIQKIDVENLQQAQDNALLYASSEADKNAIIESYSYMKDNYSSVSQQLNGMNLPMGHNFYPYCASTIIDPRCKSVTTHMIEFWSPIDPLLSVLSNFFFGVLSVISSQDGWVWLFRIILTTGMIGLGAPFWYKAYRFIGQFVPGRQASVADSTEARRQTSTTDNSQNQPIQIKVFDTSTATEATPPTTTVTTRGIAPAQPHELKPPVSPVIQPVQQTFKVQNQTGLLKDDLFNILKNTPIDYDDKV